MPLHSRPSKCDVRRIYVCEPVVVPPDTSMNVPVRMPFVNLSTPKNEWLTEPKEVRPGLLAARTLLSHDDCFAAIALMNVSGTNQALCRGLGLGVATLCPKEAVRPFAETELISDTNCQPESVVQSSMYAPADCANDLPPPPVDVVITGDKY